MTTASGSELREVAGLFLKLGFTAFGGPAAHIAMMEQEVVRRLGWLSREEFLDLLGAANLLPGPSSTELAIFIGYRRAGLMGLFLGGVCFILPAVLIVSAIAWAYVRFGKLPQTQAVLYGIKPVIIAIIAHALWRLAGTAIKNRWLAVVAAFAMVLSFARVNPILLLFVAGAATVAGRTHQRRIKPSAGLMAPILGSSAGMVGVTAVMTPAPFSLWALFVFFLKTGSVLFGSGYVLLAFLRTDLVERWHWLNEAQLVDAVAVGQFTPGPVFTTATFIGYILGGPKAAALATIGIFLPSFFLVLISGPLVPRLRASPVAGAFLDGVNAASLALLGAVTVQLGDAALVDWLTVVLAVVSGVLLWRCSINSAWLVLGGALVGLVVHITN